MLILRGAIRDGEEAYVEMDNNGHIVVRANHSDSELEDDDDMIDEEDAALELDVPDTSMDLYE